MNAKQPMSEDDTDTRARLRRTMSGLEYMQALVKGEIPQSGMSELLGFRLAELNEGRAVVVITPGEQHYNGLGIVHGGLAATLLDSALGAAINSKIPAGQAFATLEMKINYVRPIRGGVGELRCVGNVIHVGGRVATAEGRVEDAEGTLYAHGTATCMLFRQRSTNGDS